MEFLIKEICDLVGLTPRTVRFYEKEGLLPEAVRTFGNYRVFVVEDVVDLLRIKRLRSLGFSLDQIRDILKKPDSDETKHMLSELDAKLAQEFDRIAMQRAAIAEILETGAPLDIVPEYAALIAKREGKVYSNAEEDERDKMRLEMLNVFGNESDKQRTLNILKMQIDTPEDPLMITLNNLDAQFESMDDSMPENDVKELVDAYVDALTELYIRAGKGIPAAAGMARNAALYDGVQAEIIQKVMDGVARNFSSTSI